MKPTTLHILGTGGGRHTMSTQRRRTAGIRLQHADTQIHIDPGPGALVHSIYADLPPTRLDAVIVTHCHPDHYTDAEVLIEAMTGGTTRKQGTLAASRSVLHGGPNLDPSISRYHQRLTARVEEMTPGTKFNINDITIEAIHAEHGDPDAVCIKITTPDTGTIAYTSDTEAYPGLGDALRGTRLLIMGTMWPRGSHLTGHLCTEDALKLIKEAKPQCAATTHYGIKLLNADPAKEAAWLQDQTGVPTFATEDGMKITLADNITIKGPRKTDTPRTIPA